MPQQQCPAAVANPLAATVAIFVRNTTLVEAVELSNLDSGGSSIDCDRLNGALLDAYNLLQSHKLVLPAVCSEVIDLNLSRWMVIIARYYLDNIRRRPDVTADYESVLKQLDDMRSISSADANDLTGAAAISLHLGKQPVYTQRSLSRYMAQT